MPVQLRFPRWILWNKYRWVRVNTLSEWWHLYRSHQRLPLQLPQDWLRRCKLWNRHRRMRLAYHWLWHHRWMHKSSWLIQVSAWCMFLFCVPQALSIRTKVHNNFPKEMICIRIYKTNYSFAHRCLCNYGMCGRGCALPNPCAGIQVCENGGQCEEDCNDVSDYFCNCTLGWTGKNCSEQVSVSSTYLLQSS